MVRALLLSVREEKVEDDEMQTILKSFSAGPRTFAWKINSPERYATDASSWV